MRPKDAEAYANFLADLRQAVRHYGFRRRPTAKNKYGLRAVRLRMVGRQNQCLCPLEAAAHVRWPRGTALGQPWEGNHDLAGGFLGFSETITAAILAAADGSGLTPLRRTLRADILRALR